MHLKIRYRGKLLHPDRVTPLREEVEDICRSNGWEYHLWTEDWSKPNTLIMAEGKFEGHAPLQGIGFNPGAQMETVWLTFTPDGMINSLFSLINPLFTGNDAAYPWNRVKTSFGDARGHAGICNLFRYVAGKYFADFQVLEETGYWIHGDYARLEKFMDQAAREYSQLEEEIDAVQANENIPSD